MNYVKMADILHPVTVGNVEVDILDYTNKKLGFQEMMARLSNERYARLLVNGQCMMSETPMEHRTNAGFVINAYGDVLIGGLGIGMVILAIQDNPEVRSITVIENNPNVIQAVKPQLPLNDKVRVICDDVFKWKPDMKFDCVYMDIWFYAGEDEYEEMKTLKRKYGHYLKPVSESPKRFNECWAEYYAKNGYRLY